MILRKKSINKKKNEVEFHIAYSPPEVRKILKKYVSQYIPDDKQGEPEQETDIKYWLSHSLHAFGHYPQEWATQLADWAFAVAIRCGFLMRCEASKSDYYFASEMFNKVGRPPKIVVQRPNL